MTTWRARLGVLAVFVAGFLCGGATLLLVQARAVTQAMSQPGAWTERTARRLTRQLDLSGEQQRQVRAILSEARAESSATLKGVQPRMTEIYDRAQGRVHGVLDAKQKRKFAEISARRRARFLDRFGGPAAPDRAPPGPAPASQP